MTHPSTLILAHGGAGARAMTAAQRNCLADALVAGYDVLRRSASAVNAVEATIRILEASGLFNAGVGSRLQLDGARRMDASIMEGRRLRAGAVAAIEQVRHPITAARIVMEETAHVLLVGESATRFARHFKLERQPLPTRAKRNASRAMVRSQGQASELQRKTLRLYRAMSGRNTAELGTVGAVALDRSGTVAAGASTGGVALMLPGRVGDTPLIGCGVYADDAAGAVSMTGLGESIIRLAVAKEIADRLEAGVVPATAARLVLDKLVARMHGAAGALVLRTDGRFAIRHTTPHMCAGYWLGAGKPVVKDKFE
ncbi:MAG: isoaspartyl peptidase/L-asparaginase [Nitrospirae bacterium]|nr:isoaspartyl peptidase/L-asparaginase [Nitrospirota bacterium]